MTSQNFSMACCVSRLYSAVCWCNRCCDDTCPTSSIWLCSHSLVQPYLFSVQASTNPVSMQMNKESHLSLCGMLCAYGHNPVSIEMNKHLELCKSLACLRLCHFRVASVSCHSNASYHLLVSPNKSFENQNLDCSEEARLDLHAPNSPSVRTPNCLYLNDTLLQFYIIYIYFTYYTYLLYNIYMTCIFCTYILNFPHFH